jgi:hypothetical protein
MLETVKNAENYSVLLEKLKGPLKSFNEGLTFLETSSKFAKAGFTISFVVESGSGRAADYVMTYGGIRINVEVSQILLSDIEETLFFKIMPKIRMALSSFSTCYAGIISLPQENASSTLQEGEIIKELNKNLGIAKAKNKFHTFTIGNIMEFGVCTPISPTDLRCNDYDALTDWITSKNTDRGDMLELNPGAINQRYYSKPVIDKVEDKIRKESAQTRSDGSYGMIILVNENYRLRSNLLYEEAIKETMSLMERKVNSSRTLFAAAIYDSFGGGADNMEIGDKAKLFVRKTLMMAPQTVMMLEQFLMVFNQGLITSTTEELRDKMITAFKDY